MMAQARYIQYNNMCTRKNIHTHVQVIAQPHEARHILHMTHAQHRPAIVPSISLVPIPLHIVS